MSSSLNEWPTFHCTKAITVWPYGICSIHAIHIICHVACLETFPLLCTTLLGRHLCSFIPINEILLNFLILPDFYSGGHCETRVVFLSDRKHCWPHVCSSAVTLRTYLAWTGPNKLQANWKLPLLRFPSCTSFNNNWL